MSVPIIRIHQSTKEDFIKLDFIKKHSFDSIIMHLIRDYKQKGRVKCGGIE